MQSQLFSHLRRGHGYKNHKESHEAQLLAQQVIPRTSWQILLVGKHKQQAVLHFTVAQYTVQLLLRFVNSFPVLAVNDEHEALCSGIVVPPEGPNLVLSSDVPHVELDVLICHRLHVETD